jgi:hypothetical protein
MPWPGGMSRANLGPGVYAWGDLAKATQYQERLAARALEEGRALETEILTMRISSSEMKAMKTLDLRRLSDKDAARWLDEYSQYGNGLDHGYEHVIRGAGLGDEFYFSSTLFRKEWLEQLDGK